MRQTNNGTLSRQVNHNIAPNGQRGVALITVMLVLALCAILAIEMLTKQNLNIIRMQNMFERQQAYWYALSAEAFTKRLLAKTLADDDWVVNLEQAWAQPSQVFPVDGGTIEGQITDLNACYNLNALYDSGLSETQRETRRNLVTKLLEQYEFESPISRSDMVSNIEDWLDPDDYPIDAVGYDGDMYGSMDFPYLSANSTMASLSELRLIYGFTPQVIADIADAVCVIPNSRQLTVNVNTISKDKPQILMALLNADQSQADAVLAARPDEGFDDIQQFWDLSEMQFAQNLEDWQKRQFTVKSKFFKLVVNTHYLDSQFALTSIIQITDDNDIKVVARYLGGSVERTADTAPEQ